MSKDYTNACIYKICCNDSDITDVYVGSTINLVNRRGCHKTACNNPKSVGHNLRVYQFIRKNSGFVNCQIVKLQDINCKEDLFKTERRWVEKLGATLNKNIPSRSQREWNDANRDYHKHYYRANKDTYNQPKKEKLVDCRKERVTCACGSCVLKVNLSQHHTSKKHLNFLESTK